MLAIYTDRLDILPLSKRQLSCYLNTPELLAGELALDLSKNIFTESVKRASTMKLEKLAELPEERHAWQTYWLIVVRNEHFGVGLIGYKGFPCADGMVLVGYGIDPVYQGHGYASEALAALDAWAFQEPSCRYVVADIEPDNSASQRVVQKCGYILQDDLYKGWPIWRHDRNMGA